MGDGIGASDIVRHICWVTVQYRIDKKGRRWFRGTNVTPGQKSYCDKIEINAESELWQVGNCYHFHALHVDDITSFGHRVSLVPISEEEFSLTPPDARF